jgi:hypothetical protein
MIYVSHTNYDNLNRSSNLPYYGYKDHYKRIVLRTFYKYIEITLDPAKAVTATVYNLAQYFNYLGVKK